MLKLRGKALLRMRAGNSVPNRCKLRILSVEFISETVGDKLHCQEGNSPEHQLRPLNNSSVIKEVGVQKQSGGLLRSSNPLKSA